MTREGAYFNDRIWNVLGTIVAWESTESTEIRLCTTNQGKVDARSRRLSAACCDCISFNDLKPIKKKENQRKALYLQKRIVFVCRRVLDVYVTSAVCDIACQFAGYLGGDIIDSHDPNERRKELHNEGDDCESRNLLTVLKYG